MRKVRQSTIIIFLLAFHDFTQIIDFYSQLIWQLFNYLAH